MSECVAMFAKCVTVTNVIITSLAKLGVFGRKIRCPVSGRHGVGKFMYLMSLTLSLIPCEAEPYYLLCLQLGRNHIFLLWLQEMHICLCDVAVCSAEGKLHCTSIAVILHYARQLIFQHSCKYSLLNTQLDMLDFPCKVVRSRK